MDKQKEEEQRRITFNGLTAKEWASLSKNVWDDVSSPRRKNHLAHGATFPEKLVARLIKMYTKKGDLVFDPFLGTGMTLTAARNTGRKGIGIELNPEFVRIAKSELGQQTLAQSNDQVVIHDDCRNLLRHVDKESVQLMVTSPPYANFIRRSVKDRKETHKTSLITHANKSVVKPYSDSEKDFGNLEYNEFLKELKPVMEACFKVTRKGGYNVWVVKDYRDTKKGISYINFHTGIANLGEEVGFKYHDLIIWDQTGQRKLVLLGYPSVFYTNQNCTFLVVLRRLEK